MPTTPSFLSFRTWEYVACAAGLILSVAVAESTARAGSADRQADAQSAYQQDRAACMAGRTNQDRATCLREAGAALQETRRGNLADDRDQAEHNRLLRCDRQPADDRRDCVRRMNGEGTTRGSVAEGGVYRELVTPVAPQR